MLIRHRGHEPSVDPAAYIAPNATLVGDVRVGPGARVMYGAVLDAQEDTIEVGATSIICENVVMRGAVTLGDHVFVGPQSTLLGCTVARCCYLATGVTVLQQATLGAGAVVAIGASVHAGCEVPGEFFVPPGTIMIGGAVYAPGDPALPAAVRSVGFAKIAFGVETDWEDRLTRYEQMAEIRSAQFGAHADDVIL